MADKSELTAHNREALARADTWRWTRFLRGENKLPAFGEAEVAAFAAANPAEGRALRRVREEGLRGGEGLLGWTDADATGPGGSPVARGCGSGGRGGGAVCGPQEPQPGLWCVAFDGSAARGGGAGWK